MALEDTLKSWARAPGQTELDQCDNAVNAVCKAINAHATLSKHDIKVFAQGSYCNRTNVREDSDVDVCVLCTESMFCDYPEGTDQKYFGNSDADYNYPTFKNDVEAALTAYFKNGHVTRGNKAFDIKENTYRIAADAVPCFEHRRYRKDGTWIKPTGTAFIPDDARMYTVNWPEQNYKNGVTKNTETGGRFKDVVRILKRLRYKMCEEKIAAADPIPSFLVECLVWNAPPEAFGYDTLTTDVREVLANLFNGTLAIGSTVLLTKCIEFVARLFKHPIPSQIMTRVSQACFILCCIATVFGFGWVSQVLASHPLKIHVPTWLVP